MRRDRSTATLALALLAAAGLSACGDTDAARFASVVRQSLTGPDETAREPTRAELNQVQLATIAVRPEGATRRSYLTATTVNDDYVTYYAPAGRSLTFKGGAIAGHRGLSHDLMGFNSSPNDPLVTPAPLADWPDRVDRVYQFRGGDGKIFTRAVVCAPIRGEAVKLEIKEIVFDVVEVEDRCRSGALAFSNRYWVAVDTGLIWKSVQWTGPSVRALTVEIIRPFGR